MPLPTSGLITINDRGARTATTFGSVEAAGGNMVFIKKLTASSSGTLSFVDGSSSVVFDSTYKEYVFTFKNIHPATGDKPLLFQTSTDTGSNYGVTATTTHFRGYHFENDSDAGLGYQTGLDQAQSTAFINITHDMGTTADYNLNGILRIFNPSSTTFVKHFLVEISQDYTDSAPAVIHVYNSGYFNTTSAVDAVQFKMGSGNIASGDICLYGIL